MQSECNILGKDSWWDISKAIEEVFKTHLAYLGQVSFSNMKPLFISFFPSSHIKMETPTTESAEENFCEKNKCLILNNVFISDNTSCT